MMTLQTPLGVPWAVDSGWSQGEAACSSAKAVVIGNSNPVLTSRELHLDEQPTTDYGGLWPVELNFIARDQCYHHLLAVNGNTTATITSAIHVEPVGSSNHVVTPLFVMLRSRWWRPVHCVAAPLVFLPVFISWWAQTNAPLCPHSTRLSPLAPVAL